MIQLRRITEGDILDLEYGQLGVEIYPGADYACLYVGTNEGQVVPVISRPYYSDGIRVGNGTSVNWGSGNTLVLSASSQIMLNAGEDVRIYSGNGGWTGYFEEYAMIQNSDSSASISTSNGIDIRAQNKDINVVSSSGQLGMQGNDVSITASPSSTESSSIHLSSTITLDASSSIYIKTDSIMMADKSGSNELYISSPGTIIIDAVGLQRVSAPVTDNDLVTKKYVTNLSYSPQASINTKTMVIMGFVRQLNEVLFSIPLDWQLSETSFYDCQFKSGNMEVMQGDANTDTSPTYIFGGRQGGQPVVGNVKVGNVYRGNNILTIRMVKEDGSNFTNAHTGPCCIMLRNVVISGTPLS